MIDTKELRRLAQAATKGPWVSQGRYIGTPRHMSYVGEVRNQCGNWSDTEKSRSDAAYIAAANPAAITELLDRLEAAEKERDDLRAELDALKAWKAKLNRKSPLVTGTRVTIYISCRDSCYRIQKRRWSRGTPSPVQKENEMSTEFKREDRYTVFKLSDVERYLTNADRAHLAMMKNEIDAGRDCANKPPFKGLIVESDWPEYEPTWKAIEARVTGAQPAPSFADAYQGAREEVAIWKRRALEAEALTRKFIAEINGPTYMGEPAQPAPSVPDGWLQHAARMATLAKKLREPDWCLESIREMQRELRTLEEAALAAAPGEVI